MTAAAAPLRATMPAGPSDVAAAELLTPTIAGLGGRV
jgi:hypothetical protein